jgi:hypothetical protein
MKRNAAPRLTVLLTGAVTAALGWLNAACQRPADAEAKVPESAGTPRPAPTEKPATPKATAPMTREQAAAYRTAIAKTAAMLSDPTARTLAQKLSLDILSVTWEDTGRYKGSSVGPNISDMTIQVAARDEREKLSVTCMPVIRFPNFSDVTCDLDPRDFTLLVGNERDGAGGLRRVSLYELLENPTAHLTKPDSWGGSVPRTLLAPERDSKVLVSAQACFLPVPKQGIATFNPVVFNYQSYAKNPAVLTILATREGTSVTVIGNQRDAFETGAVWGQRLFHNAQGMRASLTGQRQSDFAAQGGDVTSPAPDPATGRTPVAGLNMVLLIQVPLKQKERPPMPAAPMALDFAPAPTAAIRQRAESNVENAVIGHGELEGPFTELDDLPVERDPRFPVRVTVQFYKATDNGVVSDADLRAIKGQIDRVYQRSEYVGSLVTGGETGRVTEYDGPKVQPADWWERFWERYESNTGVTREEAKRCLGELLGPNYPERPVTELYLRDVLRSKTAKGA